MRTLESENSKLKTENQKNTYEFLKLENSLCDEEQQHFLFHEWYLGALYALTNQDNPDIFPQAANSLREIMEKLVMHHVKEFKQPSETRNKEAVKKFYEKIDPRWRVLPRNFREDITNEFSNLREKLEDITHHNKLREPLDDSKFSEFIERFEKIILRLNPLTKEEHKEIDMFVANRPKNNERLLSLAKRRGDNFMYFFEKIDDDETWFCLLNENGFFNEASDDIRYSPSFLYLKKIAGKITKEVVATILKMQRTNNLNTLYSVAEIALTISLEESIKLKDWILKDRIFSDLRVPYIDPDIISRLIKYWSQKEINGTNTGMELIKEAVSFEPDPRYKDKQQARKESLLTTDPENPALKDAEILLEEYRRLEDIDPQPKLRGWEYCEVLRKGVCPVCEYKPFEVSIILINATSDMLSMRSNQEEREKGIDYSERWCPSLEGATHEYKGPPAQGPIRKLVQTLTLACEQVYKKAPEKIQELDKILAKEKWRVFKRIHSHLDTLNPNEQPKLESLKDEGIIDVTAKMRRIDKESLHPRLSLTLPADTSVRIHNIIRESPISIEELSSFTDQKLLNYINDYQKEEFIVEGPNLREISVEGLAEEFGNLFKESIITAPGRINFWFENLKEIKYPIYIYSIFQKVSEEVREGNLEQLDIWFEFCRKILSEPFEINHYDCVIDFVEACLSANELPIEKYESLLDILCTESGLRINEDVILTLDKEGSISTYWHKTHGHYRSRTLAALVKLEHRIRKHNAEANVDITTILEEHLSDNMRYPLRPSERGTLAEQYINISELDEKWALKHKDKFFPKDDLNLFKRTLSHFLAANRASEKTFEIISSELCFAIQHLSEFKNTDNPSGKDLIDLIKEHLSCYYVIGAFPLKGDESLLQKYYHRIKRDHKERWGDLFYFMGDLVQECSKDYEQKFKDYFDWRFQETNEELRQKELEKFSPCWFNTVCLDHEWILDSYSKILEIIVPESVYSQTVILKGMLPRHIEKVLECFAKLVRAIKSKPELKDYLHDRESIESILRAGFSSQDKTVRDNADQAVKDLLEMGFHWVLDLIRELENR